MPHDARLSEWKDHLNQADSKLFATCGDIKILAEQAASQVFDQRDTAYETLTKARDAIDRAIHLAAVARSKLTLIRVVEEMGSPVSES